MVSDQYLDAMDPSFQHPQLIPPPSERWHHRPGRIRVTRACDRCKKRKIRCTGQQPCKVCAEASVTCSYNAAYTRGRRARASGAVRASGLPARLQVTCDGNPTTEHTHTEQVEAMAPGSTRVGPPLGLTVPSHHEDHGEAEPDSRASPEPTQTDLQGHYVGPSSGMSFLSRVQKRFEQSVSFPRGLSVFNFGDAPLPFPDSFATENANAGDTGLMFALLLDRDETRKLVRTYFDFAVPVDRFLHRPSIERWLEEFYETRGMMRNRETAPAQVALLFMVFAIAQEHTSQKLSLVESDTSGRYFQAANQQLSREKGVVRLASVQARLCQCLWLLSQSRINHCWSLFGTVSRLMFALGLHRNRPATNTVAQVESECRRRTFWSAYALDNYLSTALGRPRTFNDKDIDQELPSCVDDEHIDIVVERPPVSVPQGLSTMFGPVSYARLSRILSGILSDIYSIQPMSITERFSHTVKYMKKLKDWRQSMATFLDQNDIHAAPLVMIYQRQRNVLNLAYWHTVILTNRPLLLTNFARLSKSCRRPGRSIEQGERRAQIDESVQECLHAAMEIVSTVDAMIQAKQLFRAFWFTPYFAFSASVILYVYTIQHSNETQEVYQAYFDAAEKCQQQIMDIAEEGSLTSRYCLVLEELRAEAVRQMVPEMCAGNQLGGYPGMDLEINDISNIGDVASGFAMTIPDLVAMAGAGQVEDFYASPSASLEDLTGWGQFDSMVVSGFNVSPLRSYL